ncbi:MAG: DUF5606 domain-containing protein [Mangrovibacterium sp.]
MLKGILAISGQPGLFKLISEGKNSIIVESLLTDKRMPAYATARISALEEISIYTETGEESLKKIFQNLHESTQGAALDKMNNEEMTALFEKACPEYDHERVYTSDIRKVFQWYNLLLTKELLDFSANEETSAEAPAGEEA